MKLYVEGDINRYYVQTLCMIFFPGEKFHENEEITPTTPKLKLVLRCDQERAVAYAEAERGEKRTSAERDYSFTEQRSEERTKKLAVGAAVIAALGELVKYKPAWGMLVGVRPSKVAMEMLNSGMSKSKTKRTLVGDFLVTPKKAGLAVDVARKEKEIIGNPQKKDCSVYISIPFCPTRCSYCSFVSYTSKRLLSLIPEYLERLCLDLRELFATIKSLGLNLKTIYIGGGTPTTLDEEQLRVLLSTVSQCCDVNALEEYTCECGRPDTINEEKLKIIKEYGVNRISVNAQSLCDEVLKGIGRDHSAEEFYRAYNIAKESGIQYINTDLIAGLPKDNYSIFSDTVDSVIKLKPDNITVHTFCVKKSADILKQDSHIYSITGGDVGKCVDYSQLRTAQAGYTPYYMYRQKNTVGNYENVGFSLPGAEGLYNVYMMEEVHSIFSAGAGAVTKLVDYNSDNKGKIDIDRIFNAKYPYEYLESNQSKKMNKAIVEFFSKL